MVHWSKKAQTDLKNIYEYIFEDSPQNAQNVLDEILQLGDTLDQMPTRYRIEPFYGKPHTRYAKKWHYKLIYRIHGDDVTIKRILSEKQDIRKHLRETID